MIKQFNYKNKKKKKQSTKQSIIYKIYKRPDWKSVNVGC